MTERAEQRATRGPSTDQMIAAVRLAAVLGGCTCDAEITLRPQGGGVFVVDVAHERGCQHPSQRVARP